jgi:hypothetical protein
MSGTARRAKSEASGKTTGAEEGAASPDGPGAGAGAGVGEGAGEGAVGEDGKPLPPPLHSFFSPRLKRFLYKGAPSLPQGLLEERERVVTAFAELILGVPGRYGAHEC